MTTHTNAAWHFRAAARAAGAAGAFALLALAGTAAAYAQSSGAVDARWQAWLGCWQPVADQADQSVALQPPLVCVVPAGGRSAVNVLTVADGKVVSRERLEATGERRRVARDGCSGWESAWWSADGRRVYLRSDVTCSDGLGRISNGMLAMSPGGEWLDVQGVTAGGGSEVRVARYRAVGPASGIPADVASAIAGRQLAVSAARTAASARVTVADVVEATRHLDAPVVQAWLTERGQGFELDAKQLIALAEAGVPGAVTDVMVALSYPKAFALDRAGRETDSTRVADAYGAYARSGRTIPVYIDPFGWGYSSYWSRYGYSPYGIRGGYGVYGWYGPPVVVVRGSGQAAPRGQAVKGRGYRRRGEASGTATGARPSSSPGASGASSAGRSSSAGRASSSGGSSGRTAKPRP